MATEQETPLETRILDVRARLMKKYPEGYIDKSRGKSRVQQLHSRNKVNSNTNTKPLPTTNKIGLVQIPGVDEIIMVKEDGKAVCFNKPKFRVAMNANTFIVDGSSVEKKFQDVVPFSPDFSPEVLQKFAAEFQKIQDMKNKSNTQEIDIGDNDVPNVTYNFEEFAEAN